MTKSIILAASLLTSTPSYAVSGTASYYGDRHHGRTTASGVPFDQNAYTAAHRTLPFGTRLSVKRPANGSEVEVIVNDRGPYVRGRILDLSKAAAKKLGMLASGVATVEISVIK